MRYAVNIPSINLEYTVSPSKSVVHRELIIGFLLQALSSTPDDAGIREIIEPFSSDNDDIRATRACLKALYKSCAATSNSSDDNSDKADRDIIMQCNESGSTLRFMISVGIAYINYKGLSQKKRLVFLPKGKLIERPLDQLIECLSARGVTVNVDKKDRIITVQGTLKKGCFTIQGNVSSQYISGLLMALTVLPDFSVKLDGELESKGYFDLTIGALKNHGITVNQENGLFTLKTPKAENADNPLSNMNCTRTIQARTIHTQVPEGDWSSAAFLLCLGALAKDTHLVLNGLNKDSAQKDRIILEILEKLGIHTEWKDGSLSLEKSSQQSGQHSSQLSNPENINLELDASDYPDIVPYIAVVAAARTSTTLIKSIGRLRFKECDRVEATIKALATAGISAKEQDGNLFIQGTPLTENDGVGAEKTFTGGIIENFETYGDHRIAMTGCLIAAWTGQPVYIDNKDCVNKSFPGLFELIRAEGCIPRPLGRNKGYAT